MTKPTKKQTREGREFERLCRIAVEKSAWLARDVEVSAQTVNNWKLRGVSARKASLVAEYLNEMLRAKGINERCSAKDISEVADADKNSAARAQIKALVREANDSFRQVIDSGDEGAIRHANSVLKSLMENYLKDKR